MFRGNAPEKLARIGASLTLAIIIVGTSQAQSRDLDYRYVSETETTDSSASADELRAEVFALEARAQFETGRYADAEASANQALALVPDLREALVIKAQIADSKNDWRYSLAQWQSVLTATHDPNDRNAVLRRIDEIQSEHSSVLETGPYYYGDSGTDEQIGFAAKASFVRNSGPNIEASLDYRQFDAVEGRDTFGNPVQISEQKLRGSVGVSTMNSNSGWDAHIVASEDVVGVRGSVSTQRGNSIFAAKAGLNTPYWAYSQGATNDAARDYVEVRANHYGKRIEYGGSLGATNYTARQREDIGTSLQVTASLVAKTTESRNAVRLAYQFDGEYFDDIKTRPGPNGFPFSELALQDREIHSVGVFKRFGDENPAVRNASYLDVGAGYRTDRKSNEGPFASVSGNWAINNSTSIVLSAEYSDVATDRLNTDGYTAARIGIRKKF